MTIYRAAALVALLIIAGAPSSAQAAFLPPVAFSVGATASSLGDGDYNGDGIPDLVVARPAENDIVVRPGRADGTFGPALPPIAVGQDPVAVTSCIPEDAYMAGDPHVTAPAWTLPDFNLDLKCDLAVADAGSDDIAVLMGNGDGTFAKPRFIPVDGSPRAIVATVLGDGYSAVVFTEPQKDRIGTIEFTPNGLFGPVWTPVGADPDALATRVDMTTLQWSVAVADAGSNDVRSFTSYNTPTGPTWFQDGVPWQLDSSPTALAGGPFGYAVGTRDSDVTLVGFHQVGDALYQVQSTPIAVSGSPVALAPVTMAGDPANGDIAVVTQGGGPLSILRATGSTDGGGLPLFSQTTVAVSGSPTALVAWPFRSVLDPSARIFASPPPTDLALLDPNGTVSILLQDAPRLMVTPARVDFGQITAGTSSAHDISITNIGRTPAPIDHVSLFADPLPGTASPFSVDEDNCSGGVVAPGESCNMVVLFNPQTVGQFASGLFAYASSADASVFGVARFQGTADLQAAISSPPTQALAGALSTGLRTTARCSVACTVTIRAILSLRGHKRRYETVGISHVRFPVGGILSIRIPISAHKNSLSSRDGTQILLRATASTTAYSRNGPRSVARALKQVIVRLTSRS